MDVGVGPLGSLLHERARSASAADGRPPLVSKKKLAEFVYPPADEIHLYVDGSCVNPLGDMAIGVFIALTVDDGPTVLDHGEYMGKGTNNQAELYAFIRGLVLLRQFPWRERRLVITTDSQYVIGVVTKGWQVNANHDIVALAKRMYALTPGLEVHHVRGHKGNFGNERADSLALASRKQQMTISRTALFADAQTLPL